jgi:ASC-1-like (ASCH) protein
MRKIEKKIQKKYFDAILSGDKTYELRLADFEVEPGDILILREIDEKRNFTGRVIEKKVSYVGKTKGMEEYYSKEEIYKFGFQVIAFK